MSFKPVNEAEFSFVMKNEIEPFLKSLRKEGEFLSFDKNPIHYEYYLIDNAKANIVISHGFTESAEKFREVYYYFIKEGYNVFSLDHRGHGHSYRIKGKPNTVKIGKFTDYVDDMCEFVNKIVLKNGGGLPLYLYSHSMGGAVAIRLLEDHPEMFEKAVLSAPMVCANTGMPEGVASFVGALTSAIGFKNASVPGMCTFDPNATYENSNDTSKERFEYYLEKKRVIPAYRTAGPSFNWVNEAMKNTSYIVKDENVKKIKARVLLCQPEQDKMVLMPYQNEFIKKVENGRLQTYARSKHEIYNSTNDVLEIYYPDLFEFFES